MGNENYKQYFSAVFGLLISLLFSMPGQIRIIPTCCSSFTRTFALVIGPFAHWALQGEQFSQHGRREKKRSWNVPWQDKADKTVHIFNEILISWFLDLFSVPCALFYFKQWLDSHKFNMLLEENITKSYCAKYYPQQY